MNPPDRPWGWTLLAGLLATSPAFAELAVIYDSGQTRPLAPLLEPLYSAAPQTDESPHTGNPTRPAPNPGHRPGKDILTRLLPVRSPGLQAGVLKDTTPAPEVRARLAQGNPRPFFMVGSDPYSLHWLAANAKTLRGLDAVGLLVQAESVEDVRRVSEAAQGLSIAPGSGTDLARVLDIRHYPVLITRDGFMQ